uniref:Uncharacterized protein n=1 Tax=Aegilops tauschii subsp. strangulata TaxID=200361 RepID=A0A453PSQ1_AEGTS
RVHCSATMSLCPMSPSVRPVIAEMEMNAGTDQDATTVRATVVQACGMFHDTPATFDIGEIVRAKFDKIRGARLTMF